MVGGGVATSIEHKSKEPPTWLQMGRFGVGRFTAGGGRSPWRRRNRSPPDFFAGREQEKNAKPGALRAPGKTGITEGT